MSKQTTNSGYQKFLEEKKARQVEAINKLAPTKTKTATRKKPEVAVVQDSKFNQLITRAKQQNQSKQAAVEAKLNPEYLKSSSLKSLTKKGKKLPPGDVSVMRDKIANRVSKNYVFGDIISKYRKK